MDIITDILELILCALIIGIIGRYIIYLLSLVGIILPSFISKFVILAIALSVLQYFINRKDD